MESDPPPPRPSIWARLQGHAISNWRKLIALQDTPHSIAGGLAVGMFFGVSPLWGLKTLFTLGTSTVLRVNPLAAFISLTLHDFLTPFVPLTLRLQYDLGYFLLSHPHALPPNLHLTELTPEAFLKWTTLFEQGLPLLVGSMAVAVPSTIATYFIALWFFQKRQKGRPAESDSSDEA
jgi:uncharacterized protein (DUF2062 family)